jgi:mercuric ion transport protein
MKRQTLLKTGIIGSLVAAVCCFTPVLVWLFAAVGITALVVYLDYIFMPALVVFLGITAYAFFRKRD